MILIKTFSNKRLIIEHALGKYPLKLYYRITVIKKCLIADLLKLLYRSTQLVRGPQLENRCSQF